MKAWRKDFSAAPATIGAAISSLFPSEGVTQMHEYVSFVLTLAREDGALIPALR